MWLMGNLVAQWGKCNIYKSWKQTDAVTSIHVDFDPSECARVGKLLATMQSTILFRSSGILLLCNNCCAVILTTVRAESLRNRRRWRQGTTWLQSVVSLPMWCNPHLRWTCNQQLFRFVMKSFGWCGNALLITKVSETSCCSLLTSPVPDEEGIVYRQQEEPKKWCKWTRR